MKKSSRNLLMFALFAGGGYLVYRWLKSRQPGEGVTLNGRGKETLEMAKSRIVLKLQKSCDVRGGTWDEKRKRCIKPSGSTPVTPSAAEIEISCSRSYYRGLDTEANRKRCSKERYTFNEAEKQECIRRGGREEIRNPRSKSAKSVCVRA